MNRLPLIAIGLAAIVPAASALPTDPLTQTGDSLFSDGLVWGVTLGSAGVMGALGLLYYLGVGGLRHVDKENVLEHPLRQELLRSIEGRPGIHLRELAGKHSTAVTNTQWHLRKLEMAGLVKTQKVQGRRLYYPVQGGVDMRAKAIENAALTNPNASRVSDFLAAHGGCNQRALAEGLGMNPGTVRWHLRKLESAGLVRSIQEGAQVRYFLMRTPAARPTPRLPEEPAVVQLR